MADTPPPDATQPPPEDVNAQLLRYLLRPQQAVAPPAPVDRTTASLLGEALGGGTTGLAPADRESAGTRALLNFGLNMLSASGPSVMPRGFGQIFAQGAGGAQQSLGGSEAVAASRMAAQQAYEEKQQELTIARIKEAIPLLQIEQTERARRGLLGGATPLPGTSIATAGGPDEFAQKFMPLAQTIAEQTGLPAEYVLAQAAHETGFGKSSAAANNNFFGITDPKTGKLATYATPQEGAAAYVQLMKTDRYANVPRTGTPAEIGDRMALAGLNPNVPAKDKTDSYGARIGGVASMLARPPARGATAPAAPGAPAPAPTTTAPAAPAVKAPAAPVIATGGEAAGPGGLATRNARMTTVSPAVPGDVNAIIRGMTGAGADPTTLAVPPEAPPGSVQTAGPGAPPASDVQAQTRGLVVPPGVTAPSGVVQPPAPARVPDTFVPARVPLPADIQRRIDHPETPEMEDAYRKAVSSAPDSTRLSALPGERAIAIEKARAAAVAEGEAFQTKAAEQQQEGWKVLRAEQTAKDAAATKVQTDASAAAATRQQEIDMEKLRNSDAQINEIRKGEYEGDKTQRTAMRTDATNARDTINTIQILRSVEKDMPATGDALLAQYPQFNHLRERFLPNLSEADIKGMTGQGLFMHLVNILGTQLSQKAAVGAGTARGAEISQNMATLPSVATSHEGRVQLLGFLHNLAQYQINRAKAADTYYYATPHPDKSLGPGLHTMLGFDDNFEETGPPIIPRAPAEGATKGWLRQNVKPGMLFEAPIQQLDPLTKQPVRGPNGKPIVTYQRQVREDDQ